MRHIVLLLVLLAGSSFLWRFVLAPWHKHVTGKWGRSVLLSLGFAAVAVLALFALSSSTTWRFF